MLRILVVVAAAATAGAAGSAITDPVDNALFSPTFSEELDRYVAESEDRIAEIGKQAKQGDRLAQGRWCALGALKASRKAVDVEDAVATCRRLAESRVPLGMYLYGRVLLYGRKVKRDPEAGIRWIRAAADTGHSCAMFGLATAYQNGDGVAQDYREMHQWLYRSAASGCPSAELLMGVALVNGIGVEKNFAEAQKWYLRAAAQGNGQAMNNLGNTYLFGRGVPKDEKIAADWYLKGAKAGNSIAMGNIGVMYEEGRGVTKDIAEALRWYAMGALDTDANSMFRLAQAFHHGRGVEKDAKFAATWYAMAGAKDEKIKEKTDKLIDELMAQQKGATADERKVDRGEVTGSTYTNAYFGMRMKIPEDWRVIDEDMRRRIAERGAQATGRTADDAKSDALEVTNAIMLTVAKYGSSSERPDAVLAIMAERSPPNMTASEYLAQVRTLNRRNTGVIEAAEVSPATIAGRSAATYTARHRKQDGTEVNIKQVVWIDKGYALDFLLTFANEAERREMERMLNAMEFK